MLIWLGLIGGLALLTVGARVMVAGGASLALRLGITPLVIGLTIMAYGTSAPEMVVTGGAALRNMGELAIGNVIGSNICNIALILGLCALLRPLDVHAQIIRREVPVLIGASALTALLLLDGSIGRWDGGLLLTLLVGYTVFLVHDARRAKASHELDAHPTRRPLWQSVLALLGGLALLLWGADLLVDAAVTLARTWGWSELLIGLTVVAIGTSLPELALSLTATLRNETDVAVGNVVGSCTFNLLGILGIGGLLRPMPAPTLVWTDLVMLVGIALAFIPLLRSDGKITRWEGVILLIAYVGYTGWMLLRETA
ncbi:MAG: calcium/sodium antiporter [Cephaloticoccus sp.]|nr:calcium/sodium antiporter [Cephaloticoccus sp.]MCF7761511.1 calcium/sodium antiporter [Cephaloticoccus sp.]